MPEFVRVTAVQEVPVGQAKVFRVRDREIALCNAGGTIHAVKSSCPHREVSLDRGAVADGILTCPGHGWQFDLATGDSVDHPPFGVRCYPVEVRGNSVWVEIP